MWFFVRLHLLPTSFADHNTVDVPSQEGRAGSTWMETSVGSLKGALYLALMLGLGAAGSPIIWVRKAATANTKPHNTVYTIRINGRLKHFSP